MLVFALWIARGAPRPRPWIQLAALAIAVPAVLLPVSRFAVQESALDAVSMIPLWRLAESSSTNTLELVYPLAAGALVALAVFLPSRLRLALPVVVALTLVALSILSTRQIERLTHLDRTWVFDTGEPRWIDAAATGPVTYLHASAFPAGVWKHVFWNRRIVTVARLKSSAALPPLVPVNMELGLDGLLNTVDGRHPSARAHRSSVGFRACGGADRAGSSVDGSRRNHPLARRAAAPPRYVAHGCRPEWGHRRDSADHGVRLRPRPAGADAARQARNADRAEGERDHLVAAARSSNTVWNGSIPSPPDADGRSLCIFELVSPGLVGSTRLEFVRE